MNYQNELKRLIIAHPDLQILILKERRDNNDDFSACKNHNIIYCSIEELTLYKDKYWLDKDEYYESLFDDLYYEHRDLLDQEYEDLIYDIVENSEFVKSIVVRIE